MVLPVIPGAVRVVVTGQCAGGGHWANSWCIRTDSEITPDAAGISALHAIFSGLYTTTVGGPGVEVMATCATDTTLETFGYTPLDGSSGALLVTEAFPGTGGSASAPAEVSAVLTLRTALRGRQNRGRVFLPPPSTSFTTSAGRVHTNLSSNIIARVAATNGNLITGGARLGVLSTGPYVDPVAQAAWIAGGRVGPRPARVVGSPHWTPIVSFSMDDRFDVQRRRKS